MFLPNHQNNFLLVLKDLYQLLNTSGNEAQASVVHELMDQLNSENIEGFAKLINSVDMWGGSGAVWEVYIKDANVQRQFESKMLELISIMEEAGMVGKGIKTIKKTFETNIKT